MGSSQTSISPQDLADMIGTADAPVIFDVRRRAAYDAAPRVIASSRWRDHASTEKWGRDLPPGAKVVVYCVHGHEVSQSAAAGLRMCGLQAAYLQGGIEAFQAAGGATIGKVEPQNGHQEDGRQDQSVHWVTADAPRLGRMACIWLIRRFIDPGACIATVSDGYVAASARELAAQPFATAESDAYADFADFLRRFDVGEPGLLRCAEALRGAERSADAGGQDAGLAQLWDGLVASTQDEKTRHEKGLALLDWLYASFRTEGASP